MRSVRLLAVALSLTAGCASHSGITPMGGGKFIITKQQATGFPGLGNLKTELLREAAQHCGKRELQVLAIQESQPPYILGNYPRAEVTFTCE